MSLYEEALIQAKKLKEIAEADAKQAIVEDITPFIRQMISSELANKSVLFEEDDKSLPANDQSLASASDAAPVADPAAPMPSAAPSEPPISLGAPSDAPIQASGTDNLNMPMPGPDGKLVVDFDDLFIPTEPGDETGNGDEGPASAAAPLSPPGGLPSTMPVDVNPAPEAPMPSADATALAPQEPAGEGEALMAAGLDAPKQDEEEPKLETYELFSEALDKTSKRIHKAYSATSVPSIIKEVLQERLFALIEALETLTETKAVSSGLSQIFENRLEILHQKLQEANVINTYKGTKGTDMASKSLKEFASRMLAEGETIQGGSVTSPADVHKTQKPMVVNNAEDGAADKAGTHAQKVTEPTVTLKTEAAEMAKLEEELKALIAESEGDSLADDEGKQNLVGAASTIPDKKVGQVDVTKTPAGGPSNSASYVQGVSENIEHSKETGSEEEVGKTSTGHPQESVAVSGKALNERTKKLKAESIRKQMAALREELKECGMGEGDMPGVGGKNSVMGEDDTIINFNFDLSDLVPGLAGAADDDEIEITDDDDADDIGGLDGLDAGADEPVDDHGDEPAPSFGDEPEVPETEEPEGLALSERIRRGRGPAQNKTLAENRALKTQLAEQTLFNAKVVHLQPFMNNKNLTKEQKQKIVEYLDRGRTVNEVKTIYTRVKTVLENAQKAKAKAGSSSKPAGTGAASLNESVRATENFFEGRVLVEAERERLMQLAGIRRK